jgi:hypothetical protein
MESYDDGRRRPRTGLPSAANAAQAPNLFDEPAKGSITPARARKGDRRTSKDAATKANRDISDTQKTVLAILMATDGLNDDELYSHYVSWANGRKERPKTAQRVRTCRADLVKLGYVKDSGATAPSWCGNDSTIWVAVPAP